MTRYIAKAIKDNQLSKEPIVVINKPGGSAQIGSAYVMSNSGSAYHWLSLSSAQIIGPVAGVGSIKASDLTPLAQMAADTFILITRKESKFKTIKDVLEVAKQKPKSLKMGGTGRYSDDHMCAYLFDKAAKIKSNYIAFSGGGEVMANLLGGHVDVAWANPNECMSQVKGGLVRTLAVSSEKRLAAPLDCPTFSELGLDMVFYQIRGVMAAPGMPEEARKASIEMLKKASQTKEWKDQYLKAKVLEPRFIGGKDYEALIKKTEKMVAEAVKGMKAN
ncbi:tripartite tricarboxylate transporter substrate binding protein [Dethiosulfatarculus sandiegensis]|uniref:Tripartite tricarboxylate transporter substrate binding protein n=1 Tax=Dethiosulfatarculus sandiegensis TaxID=1429043 RepID=A0A0D2JB75_9BACT|nr:tripartite tricarboxylate transporter substrate binding protein [Dethiosulfatarculus sandiegensis]KIX15384.1 hypothetical protein X474_03380 [Dethiosulfatarculus sandiegensis]